MPYGFEIEITYNAHWKAYLSKMEHNHDHLRGKPLLVSILLNILITIVQVIGGLFSGSLSLLSDALHNFSDVLSLFISFTAEKFSHRQYSVQQTFGYKRAEIIAALINASALLIIAIFLGKEAIQRINNPQIIDSIWVAILAGASILVNGLSVLMLRKEAENSLNIRSAYLHLFSDMITSIVVLFGGLMMLYFQLYWIDAVLTIIIAIYLVFSSWKLLMQTLRVLMQFTPPGINLKQIEREIISVPVIKNIHHVHAWQLNDHDIHFEAHIDFDEDIKLSQITTIIETLQLMLQKKFHIHHSLFQPEFEMDDNKEFVVDER